MRAAPPGSRCAACLATHNNHTITSPTATARERGDEGGRRAVGRRARRQRRAPRRAVARKPGGGQRGDESGAGVRVAGDGGRALTLFRDDTDGAATAGRWYEQRG